MSLLVQRSVVESFSFSGQHVRFVYVKDVGQCLVSKDVYEAIGYEKEDEVKAIQGLVPEKYKIQFGDAQVDLEGVDRIVNTILLKESRFYCFLLRCKRDEAEPLMEWVAETVLPRGVRKLTSAIAEKDATIALMNGDLQNRDNQIEFIKYKNVALQVQRDVYQADLQRCQDTITHLKKRYVPPAKNPNKDNIFIILGKHTTSANDKFHGLPHYAARIQRRKRYFKLRWFDRHFPDHEIIVEIDNPDGIHAFNRSEEEVHAERKYNYFRLIDLRREDLYAMGVPAILDDEEE